MTRAKHPLGGLAVVTGASSGIGYELARLFARKNFTLIVSAEDPGIVTAAETFSALGDSSVEAVQVDLATPEGVEALYRKIHATGLPVEAIALNAGVGVGGAFLETALADELRMIRLNVDHVVHLAKLVLPGMVARGRGRVLVTSSVAGEMPGPYYAVYAATKAFLQSFSEAIRDELRDTGVTVTALQPGATDTNFFARAGMLDTKVGQAQKDDPAAVARDGFDAMMAGRDHVVAGSFLNQAQVLAAKLSSEKLQAKMQGAQTRPRH